MSRSKTDVLSYVLWAIPFVAGLLMALILHAPDSETVSGSVTSQAREIAASGSVISEKTYTATSRLRGVSKTPGVASNVQETGIGVETSTTRADVKETIVNKKYPLNNTRGAK